MKKTILGAVAVCAGGPILALGVGAPTALADNTTDSGNANVSVNINGTQRVDKGNATAFAVDRNTAIAVNGSTAGVGGEPGDTGNRAIAINESYAFAFGGQNNTAIAVNGSLSNASSGSQPIFRPTNNATAKSINDSIALANGGDNSTATAINNSRAEASFGSSQTVINGVPKK